MAFIKRKKEQMHQNNIVYKKNRLQSILLSQDGMGVVEVILIIVGHFTPYLGCVLCGQSGNVWTNLTRYTEKGGKCV